MTEIIAWSDLGTPGTATRLDPSRLVSSKFILDGQLYFDRPGLKSLIESGGTTVATQPVSFHLAVINAGYVECATHVAAGDMQQARGTLLTLDVAEDKVMSLVSKNSDQGPRASSVLLAGRYNQLATSDTFDLSGRDSLLEMLASDLSDIEAIRKRATGTERSDDLMETRRQEIRLRSLDLVEQDVRLVMSATKELRPAEWQETSSATTVLAESDSQRDADGRTSGQFFAGVGITLLVVWFIAYNVFGFRIEGVATGDFFPDRPDSSSEVSESAEPSSGIDGTRRDAITALVSTCTAGGGSRSGCVCASKFIVDNTSRNEMVFADRPPNTGRWIYFGGEMWVPGRYRSALAECGA